MTPEEQVKELESSIEFLQNELTQYRKISTPENDKEVTDSIKSATLKFAARIKFCESISEFDKIVNQATEDILELIRNFTKQKNKGI